MVKYCEFCGAELEDNASFCDECGKSTSSSVNEGVVSSVSTSEQFKSNKLKIICITLIIVVAIGAFTLAYVNSGNGLNFISSDKNYTVPSGTDSFTIGGEGSSKSLGDSGYFPKSLHTTCIKQESYKITLPNGDWYKLIVYEGLSDAPFPESRGVFFPPDQFVEPTFGYGINYNLYVVSIIDSNKPDKYMTTDFLKSIIHM